MTVSHKMPEMVLHASQTEARLENVGIGDLYQTGLNIGMLENTLYDTNAIFMKCSSRDYIPQFLL